MSAKRIAVTLTGDASQLQRAFSVGRTAASEFGTGVERSLRQAKAANDSYLSSSKDIESAANAVSRAQKLFKGAIAGYSVMSLIDIGDEWGQYASRMSMATRSADEYNQAQARLVESADRTYRSINETKEGFIQMSPPLRSMGLSLDQSIDAIDTFSGLLVVNAASAEKGKTAMSALSGVMMKGKADANAWGSIMTAMPSIVDVLARSMGKSTEEVRRLGAGGKLAAQDFAKALVEGNTEVARQVESMPSTVRDVLGKLKNRFIEFLGTQNEAVSGTKALVVGLEFLVQHFDMLMVAVGAAAAVIAARFIGAQALALKSVVSTTHATVAQQRALVSLSASVSGSSRAVVAGYAVMSTAARGAATAMALVGGPVGVATLALTAGTLAWASWGSATESSIKSMNAAQRSLKDLEEDFSKLNSTQRKGMILSVEVEIEEQGAEMKKALASIEYEVGRLNKIKLGSLVEEFKKEFAEIGSSAMTAAEKSEAMRSALQKLDGSVPPAFYKQLEALVQKASESGESVEDLRAKFERLQKQADGVSLNGLSDALSGMAETSFTKMISELTQAVDIIGMSAQQAEEYKARLAGANEEQARLAGILAGMADAAKRLEKATADKDAKAKKGAEDLLAALAEQEIQLRINIAYATEYSALIALGIEASVAAQGAGAMSQLEGLRAQEEVLARIKSVQKNITENTMPSRKKSGAKKVDEGERLIKQMKERIALIGKETEAEKLAAQIESGAVKFKNKPDADEAMRLARQIDLKQRELDMEKTLKELRDDQGVSQRKFMRELESFGKGDWAKGVSDALSEVEEKYQQIIRDRLNSPRGLNDTELAAIKDSLAEELKIVTEHHAKLKEKQADWTLGASAALINYADSAKNLFASVGEAGANVFKGMENAILQFSRTGKLNFKDLADSIISDMMRIMIQQSVTGPLAGAVSAGIGALIGGIGGGGSGNLSGANISSASWGPSYALQGSASQGLSGIGTFSFSSGGFTGAGGRYEPAGVVHRGEGVLNQDEIRAIGGEAGFNSLRRAIRGPGYSMGGMVGSPMPPPAFFNGQQRNEPSIVINSIVNAAPGTDVAALGAMLDDRDAQLRHEILEDLRRGRVEV